MVAYTFTMCLRIGALSKSFTLSVVWRGRDDMSGGETMVYAAAYSRGSSLSAISSFIVCMSRALRDEMDNIGCIRTLSEESKMVWCVSAIRFGHVAMICVDV